MRRFATLIGVASLMALALPMGGAQADSSTASATVSANVNTSISINFTDATASFGAVNAGTTTVLPNDLAYTVSTTNPIGFKVDVAVGTGGNTFNLGELFLGKEEPGAVYTNGVNGGTGSSVALNWRTQPLPGTFSYHDSLKLILPSSAATGARSVTLDYIATTN